MNLEDTLKLTHSFKNVPSRCQLEVDEGGHGHDREDVQGSHCSCVLSRFPFVVFQMCRRTAAGPTWPPSLLHGDDIYTVVPSLTDRGFAPQINIALWKCVIIACVPIDQREPASVHFKAWWTAPSFTCRRQLHPYMLFPRIEKTHTPIKSNLKFILRQEDSSPYCTCSRRKTSYIHDIQT